MAEKSEIQHDEQSMESAQDQPQLHKQITYEEEAVGYYVGWHTWAAIIALSLSNCCAVFVRPSGKEVVHTISFTVLDACLTVARFIIGGCVLGIVGSCISGSATTIQRIIGGNIMTGIANAGCVCHLLF
jgi:hypothetical protein